MPSTYDVLSREWYHELSTKIMHVVLVRLMLRAVPSYSKHLQEIRSDETFATGFFLLRNAIRLCALTKAPSGNSISLETYPSELEMISDDSLLVTTKTLHHFLISYLPKPNALPVVFSQIISDLLASGIQSNFAAVALEADVNFSKNIWEPDNLWHLPLFSDAGEDFSPQNIEYEVTLLLNTLAENKTVMQFWHDWYKGFLDGKPLDWSLQREVALIPDADWDKGPAHIADKIEEIKARFLEDKTPLAEKLELNPETGKFFVTPVPARKPDLLSTTLEKTKDALDDALNGRNGLLADDRVARVLHRCFEKYTHNPERIEMDFVDARAGLTRQMANGELADSEEILSLAEVLKNGALDIRANHPDIAANRETRATRALQELTPEQKQQLEDAQPILEALTEGEAHQDMGADIPALINDMIGPAPDYAPPVGPAVRVVNRAAKMSLMMRMKDFDAQLIEKCGYKSAEIFSALGTVVGIGLAIFGLF